jgi:hypothetical protein|nr:MAG TPA: hypothetical protein [Caudoviricetes sp.]
MIDYVEYINIPTKVAIAVIALFFIMQLVGEFLEFKGKVVPEFVKIRKIFARRKKERLMMQKMEKTLDQVQLTLDDLNRHYSTDNIHMRDEWIKRVNTKLEQYDISMAELDRKLDKNNSDTLSILIDNKRNAIISFASLVIDENKPITREQFNRIFKLYQEYEAIIQSNGMKNGEVDIAIRIIREAYENHMRSHTFIEDVRGYVEND